MSWGNDHKGPWGSTPGGGGNNGKGGRGGRRNDPPHDFDAWMRKGQDSFRNMFGGGSGGSSGRPNKSMFFLGGAALFLLWLASGIYVVDSGHLGVVLRFGEYHRATNPGLNYHLPYPIETVAIPNVEQRNKEEIGFRTNMGSANRFDKESLMLTGDRNIVDIDFEVQWKIDATNPEAYLFNVRSPSSLIKPVAESAMREVIGRNDLTDVLTTAQSQIAEDTKNLMQEMLNDYQAGIEIVLVNLSRPDVPAPVIDEFQDVKRAEQDRETAESVAEGYRNEIIPRAKGKAVQMVQEAEAYKNKVVADAKGDAARFLSVYEEYSRAKDVTRKRIFLETMEDVMQGMNKIILDDKAGNGVLPYLPLKELRSRAGREN